MEQKINKKLYTDEDIITDMLYSQAYVAQCYTYLATSCVVENPLHDDLVALVCEELKLYDEIYIQMKKRKLIP